MWGWMCWKTKLPSKQSEEMFAKFDNAATENVEMDSYDIVHDTALKVILLIICGQPIADDDPPFLDSQKYETLVWTMLGDTSFDARLLDMCRGFYISVADQQTPEECIM